MSIASLASAAVSTPDASIAGIAFVAVATFATVTMIGLGFFSRPSPATASWSFAFAVAMLSSYISLAAGFLDSAPLRALASGLLLATISFIWLGLRLHRAAARPLIPVASGYLVASVVALVAVAGTDLYATVFRVDFAVAAVFALLIVAELLRGGATSRDELMPLLLASAVFPVVPIAGIIDGASHALHQTSSADDLTWMRELNSVASIVYVICALVTLLLLTRASRRSAPNPGSVFDEVARGRLARAVDTADLRWCVLSIRLDDTDDLRRAFGPENFGLLVRRFTQSVTAALPADADLREDGDTALLALIPRHRDALRPLAVAVLERVARTDPSDRVAMRTSASMGWAEVEVHGYDLDTLIDAARAAAEHAAERGGDRWERAGVAAPPESEPQP